VGVSNIFLYSGSAHEPAATVTEPNHISAAPSTGSVALPCNDNNAYPTYNVGARQQVETKSGKLFYAFVIIM